MREREAQLLADVSHRACVSFVDTSGARRLTSQDLNVFLVERSITELIDRRILTRLTSLIGDLSAYFPELSSQMESVSAWCRCSPGNSGTTKSVHTRLVHSGGGLCVFLLGNLLNRRGDCRLMVEV